MSDRCIDEIGKELEAAVSRANQANLQGRELYDIYEQIAIQILDSEHLDFAPGELQRYLTDYLDSVRERLGLPN